MEDTPYMVAIYTRYLGGSTENSDEISGWGLQQLGCSLMLLMSGTVLI